MDRSHIESHDCNNPGRDFCFLIGLALKSSENA